MNVVNAQSHGIEDRAQEIRNMISEEFENGNFEEKIDVVGFGFSGLDARFLLTFDELFEVIETVVTVNSPNNGSFIGDEYINGKLSLPDLKNTLSVLGVDLRDLAEVNSPNMSDFNHFMSDYEEVKDVFSINSMTRYEGCASILDSSSDYLKNQPVDLFKGKENDGMFLTTETELKNHRSSESQNLLTFDADIVEMMQIGSALNTNQLEFLGQLCSNK